MEKYFMRFVAVMVLALGLISIESGLNLAGSPLSFSHLTQTVMASTNNLTTSPTPSIDLINTPNDVSRQLADQPQAPTPELPTGTNMISLNATNSGYDPQVLRAPANTPIVLNVITNNTFSCSRAFVIPSLNIENILPRNGTTPINIPPQQPGTVMPFSCSMGMYIGQIEFN
jgi:hypothetical protein